MFLVFGMIVCTIGEMLLLPAIPTFFSERTGKSAPFYMGLSGGFGNVGRMTRPTICGNVYDHWGVLPVIVIGTLTSAVSLLFFLMHASLHKLSKENVSKGQVATY
ncbi:hypothetical protein [Paenibacillus naphthalenovorans]|uniref:Arabinose ABC transporter permease n=1 Tax=Paenibacillus naphthalenovorans TaxID=162209 RepID=A0A0U2L1K5_9BACL|nr:hypothetical protein [Paenibacillus naphthalenovorans]ALS23490.1 arabinose ABC transporter permease [Paenibacillus naphthalenovorans]